MTNIFTVLLELVVVVVVVVVVLMRVS